MVFLEDPITIDAPTRFQTEEDEELAQGLADQYRIKPTVQACGTHFAPLCWAQA